MKIKFISIPVVDEKKALEFYTKKLGFVKKIELPVTEDDTWIILVSEEDPNGPELLLDPAPKFFEPAKYYQMSLYSNKSPFAQLYSKNLKKEYEKLIEAGVHFVIPPTVNGNIKYAIFDDTCGNYIQLIEIS